MTTALARELTQGIKNEVEDLGAVFKKMAKLRPDDNSGQADIGSIDAEFTEWDDSSTSVAVDALVEVEAIAPTDTNTAPATIFYAPPTQENIENIPVLQRFQQFKATFNSPDIPNHVLLEMLESMLIENSPAPVTVGIPDDFDPFADEAA